MDKRTRHIPDGHEGNGVGVPLCLNADDRIGNECRCRRSMRTRVALDTHIYIHPLIKPQLTQKLLEARHQGCIPGSMAHNSRRVTLYKYKYFICLLPSRVVQGCYGYTTQSPGFKICTPYAVVYLPKHGAVITGIGCHTQHLNIMQYAILTEQANQP